MTTSRASARVNNKDLDAKLDTLVSSVDAMVSGQNELLSMLKDTLTASTAPTAPTAPQRTPRQVRDDMARCLEHGMAAFKNRDSKANDAYAAQYSRLQRELTLLTNPSDAPSVADRQRARARQDSIIENRVKTQEQVRLASHAVWDSDIADGSITPSNVAGVAYTWRGSTLHLLVDCSDMEPALARDGRPQAGKYTITNDRSQWVNVACPDSVGGAEHTFYVQASNLRVKRASMPTIAGSKANPFRS